MATGRDDQFPGAARLHLADGVALLHPQERVFEAMLDGWRNRQLARNLALSTVDKRESRLRAFLVHAEAFPWQWTPQHADEWFGDLRGVRGCAHSTLRSYQDALRSFCQYVVDPAYGWGGGLPGTVRHPPDPDRPRGELRSARPGERRTARQARLHGG